MKRTATAAILALLACGAGAALARPAMPAGRPEAFDNLVHCRAVSDEKQRLACYDQAAAALEQAADRHDLVVVDRKQIRDTKRTLFGLDIPRLNIFGGGDNEGEEITSVEGVISAALEQGYGRWVIRLEDGSTWAQTDNNVIAVRPKPGNKVHIQKASLGSYMMRVNNQPGIRVKRQL